LRRSALLKANEGRWHEHCSKPVMSDRAQLPSAETAPAVTDPAGTRAAPASASAGRLERRPMKSTAPAQRTSHAPADLADLAAHASAPERGSDRSFGFVFSAIFALIGVWPIFTAGHVRAWALALSAAFGLAGIVRPRWLAPLNRLWMRVGLALNRIVSPVALLLVYCAAVVPTALILRIVRKDLLRLRADTSAQSYWIRRAPAARADAQMKKQF
jgi:saxitoxin biosynthesis operon SxtJ-like protein